MDIDWNAQAVKKAESFIEITADSKSGLARLLESTGFTPEEAAYGADNIEVDWSQQAARRAENYMEFREFTREELLGQLEYDGFTPEEAEAGVTAVGL